MYSLGSPHRGDSNGYTQHTIILKKTEFASWSGAMINSQWLEFTMSRTKVHDPEGVELLKFDGILICTAGVTWFSFQYHEVITLRMLITMWRMTFQEYFHFYICDIQASHFITKTCLFKYTENFTTKTWKFSGKNFDILRIFAQNIDCGTRQNRLDEAVLTNTHNLCFWAEIKKK